VRENPHPTTDCGGEVGQQSENGQCEGEPPLGAMLPIHDDSFIGSLH